MQIQCTFFSHPLISFLLIVSRSFSPKCLLCQNEMCTPRQRLVSCIQRMKMFAFDSHPAFDCVCVFLIFPCCPRLCAACCFCTQCTKWVVWDRVASCVSTEWNEFASRLLVSLWHGNNDTFLSLWTQGRAVGAATTCAGPTVRPVWGAQASVEEGRESFLFTHLFRESKSSAGYAIWKLFQTSFSSLMYE